MAFDDEVLAEEATANQMGGPVLGAPPAAFEHSEWRSLLVRWSGRQHSVCVCCICDQHVCLLVSMR